MSTDNNQVAEESSRSVDAGATRHCARCYLQLDARASICGYCHFEIKKHLENWERRSSTIMRQIPGQLKSVWGKKYAENTGNNFFQGILNAIVLALAGALLSFIPILGWIFALFCFGGALFALLGALGAPVTSLFSTRSAAANHMATLRAENTYTDVVCPACGTPDPLAGNRVVNWPNASDSTLCCYACRRVSARKGNRLFWVPYPQVSLSGNPIEYFQVNDAGKQNTPFALI